MKDVSKWRWDEIWKQTLENKWIDFLWCQKNRRSASGAVTEDDSNDNVKYSFNLIEVDTVLETKESNKRWPPFLSQKDFVEVLKEKFHHHHFKKSFSKYLLKNGRFLTKSSSHHTCLFVWFHGKPIFDFPSFFHNFYFFIFTLISQLV